MIEDLEGGRLRAIGMDEEIRTPSVFLKETIDFLYLVPAPVSSSSIQSTNRVNVLFMKEDLREFQHPARAQARF